MSGFAAWGLSILGLAVITTVAEMLLPSGKMRKIICTVSATIAVLVIVAPLPGLIKNGFDADFDFSDVPADEAYLQYVESQKAELLAREAERYVKSNGYDDIIIVKVETDGFAVKSASVNFVELIMSGNDAHIHKSEIIKLVAGYFGIGEEAVMSYG